MPTTAMHQMYRWHSKRSWIFCEGTKERCRVLRAVARVSSLLTAHGRDSTNTACRLVRSSCVLVGQLQGCWEQCLVTGQGSLLVAYLCDMNVQLSQKPHLSAFMRRRRSSTRFGGLSLTASSLQPIGTSSGTGDGNRSSRGCFSPWAPLHSDSPAYSRHSRPWDGNPPNTPPVCITPHAHQPDHASRRWCRQARTKRPRVQHALTSQALVMELQRADLHAALADPASSDTMSEPSARAVLFDTLSALQHMHSQVGDAPGFPSDTLPRVSTAQRPCRSCCRRSEPM